MYLLTPDHLTLTLPKESIIAARPDRVQQFLRPLHPEWDPQIAHFNVAMPSDMPRPGTGRNFHNFDDIQEVLRRDQSLADGVFDLRMEAARLMGLDLSRTDWYESHIFETNFTRSCFRDANFSGIEFANCNFTDCDFTGAWIVGANFQYSDGITEAMLRSCRGLQAIREDIEGYLDVMPHEVPDFLDALRAGKVDGSSYYGDCSCLAGTCERAAAEKLNALLDDGALTEDARSAWLTVAAHLRNVESPREIWFMNITEGDTPDDSAFAKLTEEWIVAYLAALPGRYHTTPTYA